MQKCIESEENGKELANGPQPDSRVCHEEEDCLPNPHLSSLEADFLYHIGYSREQIRDLFHDVKFVIMGGSSGRMGSFAEVIAKEINHPKKEKEQLDISRTDRYSFYKIGPVLSISHGMGVPSLTILLHEMIKLLHYAGAKDAIFIRIGTSGGIGIPGGTVVVTNRTFNSLLREEHRVVILGREVCRPAVMDKQLAESILASQTNFNFKTVLGGTMCTDDFYEGQGRLDGAVCEFTEKEKMTFLQKVQKAGVVNIEMECVAVAALSYKAGFSAAVVCVTLLDRLNGDQVTLSSEMYKEFVMRPQELVANFIRSRLMDK